MEWLKAIYETFGAKHPTGSLIAVMLLGAVLGALIFGGLWNIAAHGYAYSKTTKPQQSTTINQTSTDSACSNVVAGGNATIDCSPNKELNAGKPAPKGP